MEELVDIVPGQPLRRTDRPRFLRALGIDVEDQSPNGIILKCVGDAAYEMPLPPRYSEQVDVRGFVYFSSAVLTEAMWQHPLLPAYRETLEFARQQTPKTLISGQLEDVAEAVRRHLEEVQARAAKQLQEWTGPHAAEDYTDEFFYNEVTEESSWESPLEMWQYNIHARYWLLVQLMQKLHEQHVIAAAKSPVPPAHARGGKDPSGRAAAPLDDASLGEETPRFAPATPLSVPPQGLRGLLDETASLENTLSISGVSASVRSHATTIATSLVSSCLSFKPLAELPIGSRPSTASGASGVRPPGRPPSQSQPRAPRKAPPPMRQLAAPPRLADAVPTDAVLRQTSGGPGVPSFAGSTATAGFGRAAGASVAPGAQPPPPAQPAAGEVVRRVNMAPTVTSAPDPRSANPRKPPSPPTGATREAKKVSSAGGPVFPGVHMPPQGPVATADGQPGIFTQLASSNFLEPMQPPTNVQQVEDDDDESSEDISCPTPRAPAADDIPRGDQPLHAPRGSTPPTTPPGRTSARTNSCAESPAAAAARAAAPAVAPARASRQASTWHTGAPAGAATGRSRDGASARSKATDSGGDRGDGSGQHSMASQRWAEPVKHNHGPYCQEDEVTMAQKTLKGSRISSCVVS